MRIVICIAAALATVFVSVVEAQAPRTPPPTRPPPTLPSGQPTWSSPAPAITPVDPALQPTVLNRGETTIAEETGPTPETAPIAFFGLCPAADVPRATQQSLRTGETSPGRFSDCVNTLVLSAMPLSGACAACSR